MARLTTRIADDTHRRLRVQAALLDRSIEEIVGEALQDWLTVAESAQDESEKS